jgi:DNA topoisomerase-1
MPPKYYKKNNYSKIQSNNLNNAKFLVIVESPSKCAKIENYLGVDYCCIATIGHLRQIVGLKSIDTKTDFKPSFTLIQEKKSHIDKMKDIIDPFPHDNIYLATDDDREGEAISWHICEIFNLPIKTTKRILFHEITKSAITEAINNPTIINMKLVMAQHARQILDIIVGYKISPFLWKHLYNNSENSLSAGRCQTPALKLVYDNNEERKTDSSKKYFKLTGIFTDKKIKFLLSDTMETESACEHFLKLSKNYKHQLHIHKNSNIQKNPPIPFHTSRLLQTASNQLHMSPKETMSLCQQLYQNGYITYMRTESSLYSKDFLNKIETYIDKTYHNKKFIGDLSKIMNTNNDNPHEAIRSTQLEMKTLPNCSNTRMVSLYKLIWRNTVESCMSVAKYEQTAIHISSPTDSIYKTEIENPIFLGWKIVNTKIDLTDEQNRCNALLLYLKTLESSKSSVIYDNISCELIIQNNHHFYTEASLINKLESLGIGRPSTFSSIIETIKDRGYVNKTDTEGITIDCVEYMLKENHIEIISKKKTFGAEKSKLIIQPIGILCVEFLFEHFQNLFSYEYTKNMEIELDTICKDEDKQWNLLCEECYAEIKTISKSMANIDKKTYEISPGYNLAFEKYGPVIRHKLDNDGYEYLSVNKDIIFDLDKLSNKEYKLQDIVVKPDNCLGNYQDKEIYLKSGPYGQYAEWGDCKESIKGLDVPLENITLEILTTFLNSKQKESKPVLREINDNLSVRKSNYGLYVYYKTSSMKKPKFLNIKKFEKGVLTCEKDELLDWLSKEYNVS